MNLHIREATETDLPGVLALYAQPDMDNGRVLSLADAKLIWTQFRSYPNYRLWVACDGDSAQAVMGTFALLVMHNLGHQGTPSAIVEDVVVHEAWQHQGVGQQMMRHAQQLARDSGCYKLVLSSNQKRQRAHAFYTSLGFQQHGLSFVIEI